MINNLLEGFKKMYKQYGDQFISDRHKLDLGLYIKVNLDQSLETFIITKNNQEDFVDTTYQWFQKRDFISKYLDSNKAITTTPIKRIHSNNYMSWFVKRNSLFEEKNSSSSDKVMQKSEVIAMNQSYFESLKGAALNKKEIVTLLTRPFSESNFEFARGCLTEDFDRIYRTIEAHKDDFTKYVRIFFDFEYLDYERESNRYFYHKIFNSDAYNTNVDGTLYGLSNFNMGMNSKKPYLEHKTMRRNAPYMVTLEEALLTYKYSLYLKTHGFGSHYQLTSQIPRDALSTIPLKSYESQNLIQLGQDNGNVVIENYDIISAYNEEMLYRTDNHLSATYKTAEGVIITKSYEPKIVNSVKTMEADLDRYLFLGQLIFNYTKEAKEIKPSQYITKLQIEALLPSRTLLYDYFYKGYTENLEIFITRYAHPLLLEAVKKGKGVDAFNVYYSIKLYCEEEKPLVSVEQCKLELNELIEAQGDGRFNSIEAYSYAAGQLANFLLSRSQSSKKNHDAVEPFLNRKNVGQLNEELTYWFKRYAHDISMGSRKFNKLYATILSYDKEAVKQDDYFLAGYLSSNIMYEKKEAKINE